MSVVRATDRLGELEAVIERGLVHFTDVGRALAEISQGHLYRQQGYTTFAEYTEHRWGFARQTAYYYIHAAQVVANVPARGQPLNFTQAKELSVLSAGKQVDFVRSRDLEAMTTRELRAEIALVRRSEINLIGPKNLVDPSLVDFTDTVPCANDVLVAGSLAYAQDEAVLREGGTLLVPLAPLDLDRAGGDPMVGSTALRFHWVIALVPGNGPPITTAHARMYGMWTPVLWYCRGAYRGDYVPDVYDSMETLVRTVTRPDDRVCEVNPQSARLARACARGRVRWTGVTTDPAVIEQITQDVLG